MPAHHDVRSSDVFSRRLHGTLAAAAERGPVDFPELLLTPGVGARTVRSLAMVAEVVHGAPYRFADPARFSLAHGGKDRHPYPVPIKVYDRTIQVLKSAVEKARLGREEELAALKRLDDQARRLERDARGGPGVAELIAQERRDSHAYGGRSVFGWEPPPAESECRHAIALHRNVLRPEHQPFQHRLRDQQPVEGIAVVTRQPAGMFGMRGANQVKPSRPMVSAMGAANSSLPAARLIAISQTEATLTKT